MTNCCNSFASALRAKTIQSGCRISHVSRLDRDSELKHGLTPKVGNRLPWVWCDRRTAAESWPGILHSLDLMPLSYRWSSRFIFLDAVEARQKLERTRKKWQQKVRRSLTSYSRRKVVRSIRTP